jgi:hypothetical protein
LIVGLVVFFIDNVMKVFCRDWRGMLCTVFSFTLLFFGIWGVALSQNDNRVPFKQRVGKSPPADNLFRIRGDFTIIGNTNLTLKEYSDTIDNSMQEMVFVDVDNDPHTFNSSSATLMLSQENGADPNCSEILYAGLYWAGKAVIGQGLTFDLTKSVTSNVALEVNEEELFVGPNENINHSSYSVSYVMAFDEEWERFPIYRLGSDEGPQFEIRFSNEAQETVLYRFREWGPDWREVENLTISNSGNTSVATFDPIVIEDNGLSIFLHTLKRPLNIAYNTIRDENFVVGLNVVGSYYPVYEFTKEVDKRKVKIKGPGVTDYTEIVAQGNSILFPHNELEDMYAGYADITQLVKQHGIGEYTVADLALVEGLGNQTGYFGHWGMIVVYQNPKMDWRDVTVFDGYSYVQSLDKESHFGEIGINGLGTVNHGPVNIKLGVMASEGDKNIDGDFLEIIDQKGEWIRLSHPLNTEDNFFNSSIYTPVRNKEGELIENDRNPNLFNNTGIDVVQWELPNPENSVIANNQSSVRFRYGTDQDLYAIYALAFSVLSYVPEIQAHNYIQSIDGIQPGDDPTAKPGEEVAFNLDIRNLGNEASEQSKIVIPMPHTVNYLNATIVPSDVGSVSYYPDIGTYGSLVWDIGEIPVSNEPSEIFASLTYTVKVTEDCFVLANNNCEPFVSMDGTVSGIGKNSQHAFSNLPFIKGFLEEECAGEADFGPIEISIVGKSEFAALHCQGQNPFPSLENLDLPDFCQGDPPTDLNTIIMPSQKGYSVYFFTEPEGSTPLNNYQVNTALPSNEQVWVSEGPEGACTGLRVPITISVVPRAPSPEVLDIMVCQFSEKVEYLVITDPIYRLNFYEDNDPSSQSLSSPPLLDPIEEGEFSVWVSQSREGECESPRVKVRIVVEDCSFIPLIKLEITADVDTFSEVNEEIKFTLEVSNPRKVRLVNVYVVEQLTGGIWEIPSLDPGESRTFTTSYSIQPEDLEYINLVNNGLAWGSGEKGEYVEDYAFVEIWTNLFPEGFLDFTVTPYPESCTIENEGAGKVEIEFLSIPQSGSFHLTHQKDGLQYTQSFKEETIVQIEVPNGEYLVTISDIEGNIYTDDNTYVVEKQKMVELSVPPLIETCDFYMFYPESTHALSYQIIAPSGAKVSQNEDGSFNLEEPGEYKISGSDISGIYCPSERTFLVFFQEVQSIELELLPFCQEDIFTSLTLHQDTENLFVHWYHQSDQGQVHLSEYDNLTSLTIQKEGIYEVTLTNEEGCIVAKEQVEVFQYFHEGPDLQGLYAICRSENITATIAPERDFEFFYWMKDEEVMSNSSVFIAHDAGNYRLVAYDKQGCEYSYDFEVVDSCTPKIRFSNAVIPGDSQKYFTVYTDHLIDELEVFIKNRWGELVYYCNDKNPGAGLPSACIWNGFVNDMPVPSGNYSVVIRYHSKKQELLEIEKGAITIIN